MIPANLKGRLGPALAPVFNQPGRWCLLEDLPFDGGCVPAGFITDLASVPRIFWSVFPPFGRYIQAAIIHDCLYSLQGTTGIDREQADRIFLRYMIQDGTKVWRAVAMHRAVRWFGPRW